MRRIVILVSFAAGFCSAAPLTDDQILETVRGRAATLEEVTRAPQLLTAKTRLLCRPPLPAEVAEEKDNPHLGKFARLYVDKAGRPAAEGHEPVHPPGTVLLKEKLALKVSGDISKPAKVEPGKDPELFTGMLKREKGFNPECGDWEFFTVSGDGRQMTSRGKLTSCMECHQRYPDQDYTSRKLVPVRLPLAGPDGSVVLTAQEAMVSGSSLRCDPTTKTLTAWSGAGDAAVWTLKIPRGRYAVEVVHASSAGNAGSQVQLQFCYPGNKKSFFKLDMKVEDTGGAGGFKSRTAGIFPAEEDQTVTLRAVPLSKPGSVVMELQKIVLRPVVESNARRAAQ